MHYDEGKWVSDELEISNSSAAVKRPTPHTSMYKYIGLNSKTSWNHFETMLNERKLYGASLKSLNDPFEGAPCIMDDLSPNLIKFMTVTRLEESFATKTGREIPNFKDVDPYRKQAHDFLNAFLANYRVAAFCDRANSPLLWSHYGNSYKGACLHFLGRAFPHQIIYRPKLGYVTYSNQRPHLPLSLALRMSDTKKFSKNSKHKLNRQELEKFCFFTKGLDWQYENEIRVIYNVKEMQHLAFQNDGLISITLGPRMPEKDKDKLSSIIRNSPFSGISIMNAQLAKNTFAVNSNY